MIEGRTFGFQSYLIQKPELINIKYKGYWKVIGSEKELVQLELQKRKLKVEFSKLVEEPILFKKK